MAAVAGGDAGLEPPADVRYLLDMTHFALQLADGLLRAAAALGPRLQVNLPGEMVPAARTLPVTPAASPPACPGPLGCHPSPGRLRRLPCSPMEPPQPSRLSSHPATEPVLPAAAPRWEFNQNLRFQPQY